MQTDLYRHWGPEGELFYIGISLSTVARYAQHKNCSHWTDQVERITIERFESREAALAAETQAIINENPKYNIQKRAPVTEDDCEEELPTRVQRLKREALYSVTRQLLYNKTRAAELLGISQGKLTELIDKGEVVYAPIVKDGKQKLISIWDIIDLTERLGLQ